MSQSVVHALQNNSRAYHERIAVVLRGNKTTYDDLWRQAQCFSIYLKDRGLKQGDRVALLLENSPEYIAAYYGTLAAGGVVVALNMLAKARDLTNWINHCGANWVVAQRNHPEFQVLTGEGKGLSHWISVGEGPPREGINSVVSWNDIIASRPAHDHLPVGCRPEDLAAIIYTSGTTGRPKGVMLSHGNLVALVKSVLSYLELTSDDSILNVLPFYYSYGNSILHTHIWVGARLVLENSLMYPQSVLAKIGEERVTGFSGVPSTYYLLLARTSMADFDWSSVRYLTQAGGAMVPNAIGQVRSAVPTAKFIVMYGQTEATARLTYLPSERLDQKLGSVGIAIPGIELRIVDEKDRPVAQGTVGEVCARGEHIMQGYWEDPEITDKVIRGGWLHTGDLGYFDDEGYLTIVGRATDMIKTGANRISPNEIEEIVGELEEVAESAAVGIHDDLLGQVIRVVIVTKPGKKLTVRQVQAYCKRHLATYKVPREVCFTDKLPRTGSGKLRRFMLVERQS